MFPMTRCSVSGCRSPVVWRRTTCATHDADPDELARRAAELLRSTPEAKGLSFAGLRFRDVDLQGRRMEFVSFSRCSFDRVSFSGSRLRYVYFDFATLQECTFDGADMAMCVFAGAEIRRCSFSGSELVQSNFLGATCANVKFGDSDLYSTRFIAARFRDVDMTNCNLKEVHFDKPEGVGPDQPAAEVAAHLGLDVKSSNAADAVYGGER